MNNKPTYLSKDGLEKLRSELDEMVSVKRPEVANRIHDAKEHGDLSENAEYEDAKNEQGMLEGRILVLEKMVRNAVLIEDHHDGVVAVGSTVTVTDDLGEEVYTIVGPAEVDLASGRISMESPVGKAVMGRRVGDEVTVQTPAGARSLRIAKLS